MKTYRAEYTDKTGKIFHIADFEANNRKEAIPMAQYYKTHTPEIQQAGRVRTHIACLTLLLKKDERLIRETYAIQKDYEDYMNSNKLPAE